MQELDKLECDGTSEKFCVLSGLILTVRRASVRARASQ